MGAENEEPAPVSEMLPGESLASAEFTLEEREQLANSAMHRRIAIALPHN
jgi:hypothetical protein